MNRERGNVALYLLFSLALAIGVGVLTYTVIREKRIQNAASEAAAAARRPSPPPPSHPAPPMPPEDEVVEAGEVPAEEPTESVVDPAERDAVEPELEDPDKDTVAFGRPGIAGALAVADVERTVKTQAARYERCLRKAREKLPVRRGTLRLAMVIGADGAVLDAIDQRGDVEDMLASCVLEVVRKLRFKKSSDGGIAKVVYPIVFAPAPDAEQPGCDEVACVLDNYELPCCAKFKRR